MIQLTQEAQRKLDRYLRQVRSALQGVTSIDPGEVEQEINEHIKHELEGHPESPRYTPAIASSPLTASTERFTFVEILTGNSILIPDSEINGAGSRRAKSLPRGALEYFDHTGRP